jgi:hypothetical protein
MMNPLIAKKVATPVWPRLVMKSGNPAGIAPRRT